MAKGKWLIPDDYSETETPWRYVLMCVPDTPQWKAIVSGAIYNLTRGRNWDESTGIIKVAQVIGNRIFRSMTMDCNDSLPRMADALEAINGKIPQLVTLQEFMDGLEDASVIGAIANWLDLGGALAAIMPNLELRLTPVEWARFFFDTWWKRAIKGDVNRIANALQVLQFVEGGETIAEGAEAIDGWVDDISDWVSIMLQGGTMGAEAAQAYALLRDLFVAEGSNDDETLRNINRVYTDVFVEGDAMTVNVNNNQVVYCGGTGAACTPPTESPVGTDDDTPPYELPEGENEYPPSFDSYSEFEDYKCQAAFAMVLNFAETLFQIQAIARGPLPEDTRTVMVEALYSLIRATDFMFGAGWLYSLPLYNSLTAWNAENIVDYIWEEPDLTPFDVFLDLRTDMLSSPSGYACHIFQATSATQVRNDLLLYIAERLDALGYTGAVGDWCLGVCTDAVSYQWANVPFVKYDNIADAVLDPAPDCSPCDTGCQIAEIDFGTGTIGNGQANVNSEVIGPDHAVSIRFDIEAGQWPNFCGDGVTLTAITGSANITKYRIYDTSATVIWQSSAPPDLPLAGVGNFEAFDQSAPIEQFNVQLEYED